jgi:hypothetical protein
MNQADLSCEERSRSHGRLGSHGLTRRVIADPKLSALCWLTAFANGHHVRSSFPTVMASDPSDIWSPYQGTTTFTDTFSPTRQSYTSQSGIFFLISQQ